MRQKRTSRRVDHPNQISFDGLLGNCGPVIKIPDEPSREAGALDYEQMVRVALNEEIKNSPFDREQIAEMLTGLVGRSITKTVLDTYTGQSRPNRLPVDLLAVIVSLPM